MERMTMNRLVYGGFVLLFFSLAPRAYSAQNASAVKTTESVAVEEEFLYDAHGRRDPFLRLVNPGGAIVNYDHELAASDLNLEGIMTGNDGQNVAIINGQILKVNDTLGVYRVQAIDTNTVILQKNKETIKLKLNNKED